MAHDHHHGHGHHHHDPNRIGVAFALNLIFTVIEIVGGILTNSVAILSDAVHDLGDSLSLGLAWYFQNVAHKGRDETYSYGYKRFSLLGAIVNSVVLLVGSIFILSETIPRLFEPQEVHAEGMIGLAILGVIVNGAAVFKLRAGKSINERVVSLHLLEDVLGWVAILIASIVMLFVDLPILDPILSLFIATFVLFNVFKNGRESVRIILQGSPNDIDLDHVLEKIATIPDVLGLHDGHLWTMDGEYHVLTLHVEVAPATTLEKQAAIKTAIRATLDEVPIQHATIEFETEDEPCALGDC